MKAKDTHITAEEAKEILRGKLSESTMVERFMEELKCAIESKKNTFNFHIGEGEDFSDQERTYLESLGYTLSWNKYCYHYEVFFPIS